MNKIELTSGQLAWILIFCRLFSLLTFKGSGQELSGSTVFWMVPLGGLAVAGLLFVIDRCLAIQRLRGLDEALAVMPMGIKFPFFAVVLGFFLLTVTITAGEFNGFLQTTVFAQSSIFLYTTLFLICCGYMALGGVGAIGGVAFLSSGVLVLSMSIILLAVLPYSQLYQMLSPTAQGDSVYWQGFFRWIAGFGDLILILFLGGKKRAVMTKGGMLGIIGTVGITMLFTFLTLTVMGDYAIGTAYPVYELIRFAGFGFMSRMDLIHILLWVFSALVKAGAYLFALTKIFPSKNPKNKKWLGLSYGVCWIGSLYLSYHFPFLYRIKNGVTAPILVTLVLGILLMLTPLWRRGKKSAIKEQN